MKIFNNIVTIILLLIISNLSFATLFKDKGSYVVNGSEYPISIIYKYCYKDSISKKEKCDKFTNRKNIAPKELINIGNYKAPDKSGYGFFIITSISNNATTKSYRVDINDKNLPLCKSNFGNLILITDYYSTSELSCEDVQWGGN